MDISKLPKLSQSEAPPPEPVTPVANQQITCAPARPEGNSLAEAWVSIAIGVILLLCFPRLLQFVSSKILHTSFGYTFTDTNGSSITYGQTVFFWSDVATTAFAVVLIVDGILMVRARRPAVLLAVFALTALTTLANVVYIATTYQNYGLPIVSALAVVFGGYIAMTQWAMYKRLSLKAN
jgi:hypothetical protein